MGLLVVTERGDLLPALTQRAEAADVTVLFSGRSVAALYEGMLARRGARPSVLGGWLGEHEPASGVVVFDGRWDASGRGEAAAEDGDGDDLMGRKYADAIRSGAVAFSVWLRQRGHRVVGISAETDAIESSRIESRALADRIGLAAPAREVIEAGPKALATLKTALEKRWRGRRVVLRAAVHGGFSGVAELSPGSLATMLSAGFDPGMASCACVIEEHVDGPEMEETAWWDGVRFFARTRRLIVGPAGFMWVAPHQVTPFEALSVELVRHGYQGPVTARYRVGSNLQPQWIGWRFRLRGLTDAAFLARILKGSFSRFVTESVGGLEDGNVLVTLPALRDGSEAGARVLDIGWPGFLPLDVREGPNGLETAGVRAIGLATGLDETWRPALARALDCAAKTRVPGTVAVERPTTEEIDASWRRLREANLTL